MRHPTTEQWYKDPDEVILYARALIDSGQLVQMGEVADYLGNPQAWTEGHEAWVHHGCPSRHDDAFDTWLGEVSATTSTSR
jgi:hypothetical protein